ncbi:hypothetical protein SAMN05444851_2489 [Aliiroseovarius sediminilitoris]|uniref:Uncharacterized protein n=1 Tax=Aliiroseovarius sediminilitoris TaxID=1173584 RepID=A0A1I0QF00_9RHOB|nr:hypothetical protein SAMN05444851_2489 [Aliiroseovarius sediminilitoris]
MAEQNLVKRRCKNRSLKGARVRRHKLASRPSFRALGLAGEFWVFWPVGINHVWEWVIVDTAH